MSLEKKTTKKLLAVTSLVIVHVIDNLPFGLEERMITRIDNNLHHHSNSNHHITANHTPSQPSPSSPSKPSPSSSTTSSLAPPAPPPAASSCHAPSSTSKLCHLSSSGTSHLNGTGSGSGGMAGGLSHSATVNSSAELGSQGASEMFDNPWTVTSAPDGITIMNHSTAAALTSSR